MKDTSKPVFKMPSVKSRKQHEAERANVLRLNIECCHNNRVQADGEWIKELNDFNKTLPKYKA